MGKSINPMCLSFNSQSEAIPGFALELIVLMSLQTVIPWRIALLHVRHRFTGWILCTTHQPKL